jgi:hypothetical protein
MNIQHRALIPLTLFLAIAGACTGAPRLLMTCPKDRGAYSSGGGPIMFLFSEPMDLTSLVKPNVDDSNADRSYEAFSLGGPTAVPSPVNTGGSAPLSLEGGRLIVVPGSFAGGYGPGFLHVFRNGFRSLKGEPLDRDYTSHFAYCGQCNLARDDPLRLSVPGDGQWGEEPVAPFSMYLGRGWFGLLDLELQHGVHGEAVARLVPKRDTLDPRLAMDDRFPMEHATLDHPPLAQSARPYVVFGRATNDPVGVPARLTVHFTVGPAVAGDLNGDGFVTVADVVLALRAALGFITLTDAQTFAADLVPRTGANGRNIGDGKVTVADASYILQRALGLVPDDQWP